MNQQYYWMIVIKNKMIKNIKYQDLLLNILLTVILQNKYKEHWTIKNIF